MTSPRMHVTQNRQIPRQNLRPQSTAPRATLLIASHRCRWTKFLLRKVQSQMVSPRNINIRTPKHRVTNTLVPADRGHFQRQRLLKSLLPLWIRHRNPCAMHPLLQMETCWKKLRWIPTSKPWSSRNWRVKGGRIVFKNFWMKRAGKLHQVVRLRWLAVKH